MPVLIAPEDNVPSINSTASQWIEWHKALKRDLGKATANTLWLEAWVQRGCEGYSCPSNTVELREYIASQGISIEGGRWSFIPDLIDDWGDFTKRFFDLGFYTVLAIVIILVAFLGLLAWNIGRDPKGTLNAAAKLKGGMI